MHTPAASGVGRWACYTHCLIIPFVMSLESGQDEVTVLTERALVPFHREWITGAKGLQRVHTPSHRTHYVWFNWTPKHPSPVWPFWPFGHTSHSGYPLCSSHNTYYPSHSVRVSITFKWTKRKTERETERQRERETIDAEKGRKGEIERERDAMRGEAAVRKEGQDSRRIQKIYWW